MHITFKAPNGVLVLSEIVANSEVVFFQDLLQLNITLDRLQDAIGLQVQLLTLIKMLIVYIYPLVNITVHSIRIMYYFHPKIEVTFLGNPPIPLIDYTVVPLDTSNCLLSTPSK